MNSYHDLSFWAIMHIQRTLIYMEKFTGGCCIQDARYSYENKTHDATPRWCFVYLFNILYIMCIYEYCDAVSQNV